MANRKLQGEIERVLKKVDEGVQVFEQIWDKVYSAATTAQKEKYEGDLKKEIKKLQRLRDQIKTWQGDSSIKDKTKLDANRKLIEEKMEKFKICEKETKTKAFSKEGLAQDRTDPKQKAKSAVGHWVREAISSLQEQADEMEAEIETLNSGKRKKRSEENPRVTDLKEQISRHEYHIDMLERVLRAVDNDGIAPEELSDLKDNVDYYIESNQDPDFFEDDEMYDSLNLDAVPAPTTTKKSHKTSDRDRDRDRDDDDDHHTSNGNNAITSNSKKGPSSPRNLRSGRTPAVSASTAQKAGTTISLANGRAVSPKSTRTAERPPSSVTAPAPRNVPTTVNSNRDVNGQRNANPLLMSSVVKGVPPTKPPIPSKTIATGSTATSDVVGSRPIVQKPGLDHPAAPGRGNQTIVPPPRQGREPVAEPSQPSSAPGNQDPIRKPTSDPVSKAPKDQSASKLNDKLNDKLDSLDPALAAIEAALNFMPEIPIIMPKQNPSTRTLGNGTPAPPVPSPRNPVATPSSFPSVPAPVFDSKEVFEQFDPDTLFFIFYYQQGTYQQYLAAKELKRQGWRFHKKYLTWFQRHDEPKLSTDEFESGTFIYFDYANVVVRGQGSGWCQRIKSEFVFEYRFLEDELV